LIDIAYALNFSCQANLREPFVMSQVRHRDSFRRNFKMTDEIDHRADEVGRFQVVGRARHTSPIDGQQ